MSLRPSLRLVISPYTQEPAVKRRREASSAVQATANDVAFAFVVVTMFPVIACARRATA